jgi:hypothetical protein
MYGSVAARDVVEILAAEGFTIGRNQVELNTPIKTIGLHDVKLALHAEVEVTIGFNVARSTDEAERQAKGEKLDSADAIYGVDDSLTRTTVAASARSPTSRPTKTAKAHRPQGRSTIESSAGIVRRCLREGAPVGEHRPNRLGLSPVPELPHEVSFHPLVDGGDKTHKPVSGLALLRSGM